MASPLSSPVKTATRIVRRKDATAVRQIETDICVVGAGIAGVSAALEAAQLGRKVALVDGLHALGGQAWSGDVMTTYRFNSPAWSVGVELFLYACLPLLLFLLAHLATAGAGNVNDQDLCRQTLREIDNAVHHLLGGIIAANGKKNPAHGRAVYRVFADLA